MKKSITIIGAGLSGLYVAYLLQDRYNITILEARNRLGGRIYTIADTLDMGPSWFWSHNQQFIKLIKEFGLQYFSHYEEGFAIHENNGSVERFHTPKQNNSFHLSGGMKKLIDAINKRLQNVTINQNETVIKVEKNTNQIQVHTTKDIYKSDYVISTLSPRLVIEHLEFDPPLDNSIIKKFSSIPTWMGYVQKVLIQYDTQFWRKENLSGFVYSPVGPLHEIHDISDDTNGILFGFMHSKGDIKDEQVIKQLTNIFGPKAKNFESLEIVNWGEELYSATSEDKEGLKMEPRYGFDVTHFEKSMFFIGTESDYKSGGYLEGALNSALNLSKKLL